MKLPKSFRDITVKQYQDIHDLIIDDTLEPIDKDVRIISVLTGKSTDEIESIPFNKLKKYFKIIAFIKTPKVSEKVKKLIWVNGTIYTPILNVSKLNTNQYVSIKMLLNRGNIVQDMNALLACFYKPVKFGWKFTPETFEKASNDFKEAKVSEVYGTLFFYLNVFQNSTIIIEDSLNKASETIAETMKEIEQSGFLMTGSESIGVGK